MLIHAPFYWQGSRTIKFCQEVQNYVSTIQTTVLEFFSGNLFVCMTAFVTGSPKNSVWPI